MSHRSCWLEPCSPAEFGPAAFAIDGAAVVRVRGSDWERARTLWTEAGRGYWSEREEWAPTRWQRHLDGRSPARAAELPRARLSRISR